MKRFVLFSVAGILVGSCAIVRPGEVGVKSRLGQLSEPKQSGTIPYNVFTSRVIKLPTRTTNIEVLINLPSKEGLTIKSEISILYKINPLMAKQIIDEVGLNYEQIITAVFRSASADVTSKFYAKDMHSGERDKIEKDIATKMNAILNERGFDVESVLMKSITLPTGLANAIEAKLEAEQKEAERKLIEAKGTRDAQLVLSEGLTESILKLRHIEMMNELSKSPNSKVIVTNGDNNVLIKE